VVKYNKKIVVHVQHEWCGTDIDLTETRQHLMQMLIILEKFTKKTTLKIGEIKFDKRQRDRQTDGHLKDCLTAAFFNTFIQSACGLEHKNLDAKPACLGSHLH
jgi:hypothetical protein